MGRFYNPEPSWFMHPADEGKPCCCKDGPAKISVKRTDTVGLAQIVMKIDLQITGCYKDLFVIWEICWRFDDAPWGPESGGRFGPISRTLLRRSLKPTGTMYPNEGTREVAIVRVWKMGSARRKGWSRLHSVFSNAALALRRLNRIRRGHAQGRVADRHVK